MSLVNTQTRTLRTPDTLARLAAVEERMTNAGSHYRARHSADNPPVLMKSPGQHESTQVLQPVKPSPRPVKAASPPVLPHTPVAAADGPATRLDIRVPAERPAPAWLTTSGPTMAPDPAAPKDALRVVSVPQPAEPAADVEDPSLLVRIRDGLRKLKAAF